MKHNQSTVTRRPRVFCAHGRNPPQHSHWLKQAQKADEGNSSIVQWLLSQTPQPFQDQKRWSLFETWCPSSSSFRSRKTRCFQKVVSFLSVRVTPTTLIPRLYFKGFKASKVLIARLCLIQKIGTQVNGIHDTDSHAPTSPTAAFCCSACLYFRKETTFMTSLSQRKDWKFHCTVSGNSTDKRGLVALFVLHWYLQQQKKKRCPSVPIYLEQRRCAWYRKWERKENWPYADQFCSDNPSLFCWIFHHEQWAPFDQQQSRAVTSWRHPRTAARLSSHYPETKTKRSFCPETVHWNSHELQPLWLPQNGGTQREPWCALHFWAKCLTSIWHLSLNKAFGVRNPSFPEATLCEHHCVPWQNHRRWMTWL